jgi:hypothetical protein
MSNKVHGAGLDVHGPELVSRRVTVCDEDGNPDVEFNFFFPLTRKREEQLIRLLEEGYSEHDAYLLLAGGEVLAHLDTLRSNKRQ